MIVIDITTVIEPLKDYSASCTVSLKVLSLACKIMFLLWLRRSLMSEK